MTSTTAKDLALFGTGLIVGGAVGYFIAQKRLKKIYAAQAELDIQSVKESYKRLNKREEFETVGKAAEFLVPSNEIPIKMRDDSEDKEDPEYSQEEADRNEIKELLEQYKDRESVAEYGGVTIPENVNVFEETSFEEVRDPDGPYVISYESFMTDDEQDKSSIVYWEGDDTLADEGEGLIPDSAVEENVSRAALSRFGDGNRDKNTVYVRNERLHTDYEITRDLRKYSVIALGIDDETPTSKGPLKMRDDD